MTRISSEWTGVMKWLSPVLLLIFGALVFMVVFQAALHKSVFHYSPLLVSTVCFVIAIVQIRANLTFLMDSVYSDLDVLRIKRSKTEDAIPLANIDRICNNTFRRPETITIFLRVPSRFGSKVVFYPIQSNNPFDSHPIARALSNRVEELQQNQ